jgi:hypothetical protein
MFFSLVYTSSRFILKIKEFNYIYRRIINFTALLNVINPYCSVSYK